MGRLFGIEPRSLAAFRMAMGTLVLGDLAIRSRDLRAMYTDAGMFPRWEICHHYTSLWNWSFHFGGGSAWYEGILFALAGGLGLALLAGFETRFAAAASWLMLLSVDHRVPPILSGADVLLRMLLFWGMFLPLGKVWSVDHWLANRRRGARPNGTESIVLSFASTAILIQMALMYLCSAVFKSNGAWLRGDVIAGALAHDFYATPLAGYLLRFPHLLMVLTWGAFALEWAGPLLLFFPWATVRLRVATVAALALMHIGIALCLEVDLFSPVALAGLVLFLPGQFWDGLLGARRRTPAQASAIEICDAPVGLHPALHYVREGTSLCLLLYVIFINLAGLPLFTTPGQSSVSGSFLGTACGLAQQWNMFNEAPSKNGWYVAWAKLEDGSEVDLLRKGAALDWNKPPFPATLYPNHRWRKCFREMAYDDELGFQVFRAPVSRFLCRDWDLEHEPAKKIVEFDLVYCNEGVPKPMAGAKMQMTVRERLLHLDWAEEQKDDALAILAGRSDQSVADGGAR